jgi:broad specificity phosphatase PhoE
VFAAIVRHGDYHQLPGVPSAHQPFPLNEAGAAQAVAGGQALAALLRQNGWDLDPEIDCSQMQRAWQTARLIAGVLAEAGVENARVSCFDALAERGVGAAANLTVEQIEAVIRQDDRYPDPPPGWKSDSRYRLPLQGAESLLEAGARVAAHLESRLAGAAGGEGRRLKLFVGHGAAFRHAAFHLGVLNLDEVAALSMFHGEPVVLERLERGRWRHVAGEWKKRRRGDRGMD